MNDQTDSQLLRAYVECRSEPAFANLVSRHVDLVYSAALRMVCDSHLAKDVTQGVFVALAKNAAHLTDCAVLSGWLHRTAQNIAAQTVRTDVRRRVREQEAVAMHELLSADPDANWEHIAPHLDAALGELAEPDRDAVLLRYFESKSAREMAQVLGISDDAAQKRVGRAVERLREFFAKRGITVGAGGLAAVIAANAVQAAPVGLTITISTTAALAGTAIAATATATVTATKVIAMTTLQKTLITATLVTAVATPAVIQHQAKVNLRNENQSLRQQVDHFAQLQEENDRLSNLVARANSSQALPKDQFNELLRLRGEVGNLRRRTNDLVKLDAENRKLRSSLATTRPSSTPTTPPQSAAPAFYSKESWNFAGYADPESAFQTALWAQRNGDVEAFLASVSPEERTRMIEKSGGQPEGVIGAKDKADMEKISGYQVVNKETLSADEVVLDIFADGLSKTQRFAVKLVGNEWKVMGPVKNKAGQN